MLRKLPVVLAALLLGACASQTPLEKDADAALDEAPATQSEVVVRPQRPIPDDSLYPLLVAEFALRRRQFDVALENYREQQALLRDPAVSAHTTRLAQFMRREDDVLAASRLWVEVEPDNLEARLILANQLARRGQARAALPHMEAILAAGGVANFTALANGFEFLGAEERAALLVELRNLQASHPDDTQLMICIALLLEEMGRPREALDQLQPVFDSEPDQLQAIVLETKLRQDLGETRGLYDRMLATLERQPDNARLRMQYARLLTRTDMAEAERQFQMLLDDSPDNPDLLFSLALIAREQGNLDRARGLLEKLVTQQQRLNEAHYYLGKTAEEQERYAEALIHYMQVQPGRDFIDASNRIAALLLAAGRTEEFSEYFDRLRASYPTFAEQLFAIESEQFAANDALDAALEALSKGLAMFPQSDSLLYNRAMLHERRGELERMEADLRLLIERDPDNSTALNALGYTLADRTDRYQEANDLISRALSLDPEQPAILDSMGWVKYRLGLYDEALAYLQLAYERFPDPEVAAHLGEVLWVMGDADAAREIWLDAIAGSPEHPVLRKTMQRHGLDPDAPR